MQPHIRAYKQTDKDACLQAFISNVPQFFTEAEIAYFSNFLDYFQQIIANNKTYYYVVIINDTLVGCGGFGDKDGTDTITLAWGLIHNKYHKKGLGELLLQHRLNEIKHIYPTKPIYIDTTQHTFGFFEKFGFTTTKITHDYYEKGMHRYDMVYHQQ